MRVVFTDESRSNLREIQSYIGASNPRAAIRVVDRITYVAEILRDHPLLGRDGERRKPER